MSDNDDNEEPDFEKHREAGELLQEIRDEAAERIEIGESLLDVAEYAEDLIYEKGAEPAFPVNISVNEEASHATPAKDDDATFGEDMVNLDIGVHVDGWIADSAITVDMSGHDELTEASHEALEAAIDKIEPGVSTAEVGKVIEETIKGYGFNPIYNLTGHGLAKYETHSAPTIPNRSVDKGVEIKEGMVIAIEPFATNGSGKVSEGGTTEIYSLNTMNPRVRSRSARKLVEYVEEEYRTLPFAKRWLDFDRLGMTLRRLENRDVIHGYPVLKEKKGKLVSQAEHTVIVQEDGCEVTTR